MKLILRRPIPFPLSCRQAAKRHNIPQTVANGVDFDRTKTIVPELQIRFGKTSANG